MSGGLTRSTRQRHPVANWAKPHDISLPQCPHLQLTVILRCGELRSLSPFDYTPDFPGLLVVQSLPSISKISRPMWGSFNYIDSEPDLGRVKCFTSTP